MTVVNNRTHAACMYDNSDEDSNLSRFNHAVVNRGRKCRMAAGNTVKPKPREMPFKDSAFTVKIESRSNAAIINITGEAAWHMDFALYADRKM